jgi:hypothetical protein
VAQGNDVVTRKRRDLDIDEDLNFQNKEWHVQRVGTWLLFAVVLGAALGLTGMGGPLSKGEAGRRDEPVFVEFERFVRRGATSTIVLHLHSAPGAVSFWVSAPYLAHVRIDSVAPRPERVAVEQGRHVYTIQSGSSDVAITLVMEHLRMGTIDAAVGLVDGPSVQFSQVALF